MKALIIYDSVYGNTEKIAQAVGDALSKQVEVSSMRVSDLKPGLFAGVDLLIVGSPTQRFRPTLAASDMLNRIPSHSLKGVKVAVFDTRLTKAEINKTAVLAFFVRLSGDGAYAARHLAEALKKSGGELVLPPVGFFVEGMEGPLVQGELDRAAIWATQILAKLH